MQYHLAGKEMSTDQLETVIVQKIVLLIVMLQEVEKMELFFFINRIYSRFTMDAIPEKQDF